MNTDVKVGDHQQTSLQEFYDRTVVLDTKQHTFDDNVSYVLLLAKYTNGDFIQKEIEWVNILAEMDIPKETVVNMKKYIEGKCDVILVFLQGVDNYYEVEQRKILAYVG